MNKEDLVGIAEIADFAEVSKQAVSNWRQRYDQKFYFGWCPGTEPISGTV